MAQLLLLMLGRTGTQISILERGDSYRPLVELMGGRVIEVNLDGNETLNPLGLPPRGKDAIEGEDRIFEEPHSAHDRRRTRFRYHARR